MNSSVAKTLDKIKQLEYELEDELHNRADELRYKISGKKVIFEQETLSKHKKQKIDLISYISKARLMVVLTAPFIYSLIIPIVLLDIFVSLYQFVCFPVYSIPRAKRKDYLIFDRITLSYLNGLEKFNCLYCSYCNGIIAFTREIAARTEQFWCPIKHAKKTSVPHDRYYLFTDYGDAGQYREKLKNVRMNFT